MASLYINAASCYQLLLICDKDGSSVPVFHTHDRDGTCRLSTNDDPELAKFSSETLLKFGLRKDVCCTKATLPSGRIPA